MNYDNSEMKPWGPSWYPGVGYVMETNQWLVFPGDIQEGEGWTVPLVGRGMFTYSPTGRRFMGRGRLPSKDAQYGDSGKREVWVDRDIVGHCVLIRGIIATPDTDVMGNEPFHLTGSGKRVFMGAAEFRADFEMEGPDDDVVPKNQCWMFAYVGGYDSYNGKHSLIFKRGDIYYPGYEVELDKCVYQEWTRPGMRGLMTKLVGETKPSH